jgi:hypothetical protein
VRPFAVFLTGVRALAFRREARRAVHQW